MNLKLHWYPGEAVTATSPSRRHERSIFRPSWFAPLRIRSGLPAAGGPYLSNGVSFRRAPTGGTSIASRNPVQPSFEAGGPRQEFSQVSPLFFSFMGRRHDKRRIVWPVD